MPSNDLRDFRNGSFASIGQCSWHVGFPVGGAATFAVDTRTICLFDPVTEQLIT
jgi:hypothetical protein